MKIDKATREAMKAQIASFIDRKGIDINTAIFSIGSMFSVWFYTVKDVMAASNADPMDFDKFHYPCGSNDKALGSALVKIFTELGCKFE